MKHWSFSFSISIAAFLLSSIYAENMEVGSKQIEISHKEGRGLGYDQGYSSIKGFFIPVNTLEDSFVPFIHMQGHLFKDLNPAFNLGTGIRYVKDRILGVNAYYDYRQTSRFSYDRMGLGLEFIGLKFDVHANAYLPLKNLKSVPYDYRFSHFDEHSLFLKETREIPFKGFDCQIGALIDMGKIPLYIGVAPYYLKSDSQKAVGARILLKNFIQDHLSWHVNASYDAFFKGRFEGGVSLHLPAVHKKRAQTKKIRHRLVEPVNRMEIIAVSETKGITKAINPQNNAPYQFQFVDNTKSGEGSFNSPFSSLKSAQDVSKNYDVLFVFAGDTTSNQQNKGIVLKEGQKLLGAGKKHTLSTSVGSIDIPALSKTFPTISYPGDTAIRLANNNVISGFNIGESRIGIKGDTLNGTLEINNNNFIITNEQNLIPDDQMIKSIQLQDVGQKIFIRENNFESYVEKNPTLAIGIGNTNVPTEVSITHNLINNYSDAAIFIEANLPVSALNNPSIKENVMIAFNHIKGLSYSDDFPHNPDGIKIFTDSKASVLFSCFSNICEEHEGKSIYLSSAGFSSVEAQIFNNKVYPAYQNQDIRSLQIDSKIPSAGICCEIHSDSKQKTNISGNFVGPSKIAGIYVKDSSNLSDSSSNIVHITKNEVVGAGQMSASSSNQPPSAGIVLIDQFYNSSQGALMAEVSGNLLKQNKGYGGCLIANFSPVHSAYTILNFHSNVSDSGYCFYNVGPNNQSPSLFKINSFSSNVGTIYKNELGLFNNGYQFILPLGLKFYPFE
ncbi:MAG: inverse autotransporter beta domain-containing protein [Rhabdochlamydiaceae bacterium]